MFEEKSKCYVTKIILFSLLVCLSVFFAFVNFVSPDPLLEKGSYNFAALGIICFVFEILLEESVLKKIKASTTSILIKESPFNPKLSELLCCSNGNLDY